MAGEQTSQAYRTGDDRSDERAPWWAVMLGDITLRFSWISRFWLSRYWRWPKFKQMGARRFRVPVKQTNAIIDCLYLPSQQPTTHSQNQCKKLPIVYLHGWLEAKAFHHRQAKLLANHGHDVILMDLRAHGRSTGRCCTFTCLEKIDLNTVIDHAQQQGLIQDQLITVGYSLGAATALIHASTDQRVSRVVALAPFSNLEQAFRSFAKARFSFMPINPALAGFKIACKKQGFDIANASPLAIIDQVTQPVLFAVGTNDHLLPDGDHTAKLAQAKTRGKKQYLRIQNAGHLSLCYKHWPQLDEAMLAFCDPINNPTLF